MLYYVSRTGTKRNRALISQCGWRWLIGPLDGKGGMTDGLRYACDNGAWPSFQLYVKGKKETPYLNLKAFQRMLDRHGAGADFIIIPDVVLGGDKSWAMTRYWMRKLRRDRRFKAAKLLIAVQNGMEPDLIEPYLNERIGIFVGGDTEWKLATKRMWADLAHKHGAICHVGRVNTQKRVEECGRDGADSVDGSSGARFAVTIIPLEKSVREVIAQRAQIDIEDYLKKLPV